MRQKIFLARVLEVFVTGAKYRFYQLSFYTSINKWSDLTNDERKQLVSGDDIGGEVYNHSDESKRLASLTDDETARKVLLDVLAKQQNDHHNNNKLSSESIEDELKRERAQALEAGGKHRRRRRDTRSGKQSENRDISVADLILVPQNTEPDPKLRIKWVVSQENPHYQKPANLEHQSTQFEAGTVRDIPSEQVREITEASAHLTPASVLKSAFNKSINWWSGEKEDSSVDKQSTIVIRDWRRSGCIGPARDQGYCASCYAIASMGFVEWALCENQKQKLTPLSVQYMVSCGPQLRDETRGEIKLDGCSAGMSRQTMDFVKEYGIELEVNMPYYERETVCPIAPNTPRKNKGYIRPNVRPTLRLSGSTSQLDLALKTGPVIVSMREPRDFLSYGGGLVERCDPVGGHAMLVVGNMIEDGVEYLLIKNSFGTYWGYDGFFKFRRSSMKECVKEFIVPMISFPGRRAQARRIKAYLADRQLSSLDTDEYETDDDDDDDADQEVIDGYENDIN